MNRRAVVRVLSGAMMGWMATTLGCGGAPSAGAGGAQVRFLLTPDNARVYNDERFVGTARALAVRPARFRAGPRRFSILAEGFFPHDLEVDLASGLTTIEISLRPIPR